MKEKIKGKQLVLVALLFAVFFLYGTYFNSFGANAQTTMAFFEISETQLGAILSAQAAGSVLISIFLALYGERLNKLRGIALGLLLMGAAALLIGTMTLYSSRGSGYTLLLLFSLIAGVGFIFIDLLMNGAVADIYPNHKNTLLPLVHAFYATGAMIAPLFVTAVIRPEVSESFSRPYRLLGLAAAAVLPGLIIVGKWVTPKTPYADMHEMRKRAKENPAEVFKSSKAWVFLLAGVFYLIFQNGLSSWLPSFCSEQLLLDSKTSGLMLSAYFAGALIMRLLSPLVYKKISVSSFYVLSVSISAAVFALSFLLAPAAPVMILLLVAGGLLQGAAVPALVILCCDAFPERTASASAIVVLAVSISGFIGPVAMGYMIEKFGFGVSMLGSTACLLISTVFVGIATRQNISRVTS